MRKVLESLFPLCGWVGLSASLALAGEAATGPRTYNGISYFYYTVINLILIYCGTYDTFFKKSSPTLSLICETSCWARTGGAVIRTGGPGLY